MTLRTSSRKLIATTVPTTRGYKSWIRVGSSQSSARINLNTSIYGHATSRGTRPYQEDTSSTSCLYVPRAQLQHSLERGNRISQEACRRWKWPTEHDALDEELASQVFWFGIFDGHGGSFTSRYLAAYLHQIYEAVEADMVTDTVQATREHGGYFRRFTGGVLEKWVDKERLRPVRGGKGNQRYGAAGKEGGEDQTDTTTEEHSHSHPQPAPPAAATQTPSSPSTLPAWEDNGLTTRISPPPDVASSSLTLSERATLAFLVADRHILARYPQPQGEFPLSSMHDPASSPLVRRGIQTREMEARAARESDKGSGKGGGSTASVLLLHSLDAPPKIWYDSSLLQLCAYHVG